LVEHVNWLSSSLNISPLTLDPNEIILTENVLIDHPKLRDVSINKCRNRFSEIQKINSKLQQGLLILTDFRPDSDPYSNSTVIFNAKSIIFYEVKSQYLDDVIDSTSTVVQDQVPPTVLLNPVETIGQNVHDIR